MNKEEFLKELEDALRGEVPSSVIWENINYYSGYISQEMAKGRTVDEIVEEIGTPRLIARTIIDTCEAAGETAKDAGASYESPFGQRGYESNSGYEQPSSFHYFDLNKWYWKLLLIFLVFLVMSAVFGIIGGIFSLLLRFSGPILVILLIYCVIKNLRR